MRMRLRSRAEDQEGQNKTRTAGGRRWKICVSMGRGTGVDEQASAIVGNDSIA